MAGRRAAVVIRVSRLNGSSLSIMSALPEYVVAAVEEGTENELTERDINPYISLEDAANPLEAGSVKFPGCLRIFTTSKETQLLVVDSDGTQEETDEILIPLVTTLDVRINSRAARTIEELKNLTKEMNISG